MERNTFALAIPVPRGTGSALSEVTYDGSHIRPAAALKNKATRGRCVRSLGDAAHATTTSVQKKSTPKTARCMNERYFERRDGRRNGGMKRAPRGGKTVPPIRQW